MNDGRTRYLETMTFGRTDRIPFAPGVPRESTLKRWRTEGLGADESWEKGLRRELGLPGEAFLRMHSIPVDLKLRPQFEEQVLRHENGHYVIRDWMGAVTEISDRYDATYLRSAKDFVTRKWHAFPVSGPEDWAEMRGRYDPDTPGRFPEGWAEAAARARDEGRVVSLEWNGPFWQMREWCGFEGLCVRMADEPGFVEEMADRWTRFVSAMLDRVLARFVPDRILVSEDMAYKEHSMISPAMARRFLMPSYRAWLPKLRAAGTRVFEMDSDGHVGELLPIWIEAGFNATSPVEVAAGNDILAYRKAFGKRMAYFGGVDKRAIAAGGATIRAELARVVPPLLAEGGFVPSCDHGVPHDIAWPDYVDYARRLARMTGWLPTKETT